MSTQPNHSVPMERLPELGNTGVLHPSPGHRAVPQDGYPEEPQLYQRQATAFNNRLEAADPYICVVVICGCSLVVLAQAAVECGANVYNSCSDVYGYTVAVGVVSFIVSLLSVFWNSCGKNSFQKFSPVIAMFFVVWWGLGTAVSTFVSPFNESGNGYFAAWGAFIASFIMAGAVSERLRTFLGTTITRVVAGSIEAKLSQGIAVSSVVLLAAIAVEATNNEDDKPTGQETWGVICAFTSCVVVLVHTLLRISCERFTLPPNILGAVLAVWWLPGVAVLTFDAPFKTSSNGYFAT